MVRGPIELPLRSAATLTIRGETLDLVLDADGKPRSISLAILPIPPPSAPSPAREPAEGGAVPGYSVPCAAAADRFFCADRSGAVHRTARDGSGDRIVASSRPGSRIAAATIATGHVAFGYLASRQTSEGWVSEAWLAVDDDVPQRISEDGSGATHIALASRGPGALALTVDARAALTALHARPVTYDGHLHLGEDVVAFVGGPGDRRTGAALAVPPTGPAWALLPIAKDVGSFGLSIVRLDEVPRVDEPVVWSMYPNGLDPAPVAAASQAGGKHWIARVRPQGPEPGAPRVLELGELGAEGAFVARDLVPTSGKPSDVALTLDPQGALWIAWVDGSGSWLERLACR